MTTMSLTDTRERPRSTYLLTYTYARGSDSEYVHAYHDYNVIDRHPGTSQIHLLTYLLTYYTYARKPLVSLNVSGLLDRPQRLKI